MYGASCNAYGFKALLGGITLLGGYGCFYQFQKYVNTSRKWKDIQEGINKFEPYEIKGKEAQFFPWLKQNGVRDWEYKIVKLKGFFKEERFFIKRQRDNKNGFLVFAPFVTSTQSFDVDDNETKNPNAETAIFVNLGWVPSENKQDISMGNNPVDLKEQSPDLFDNYYDKYSGFNEGVENPIEEEHLPIAEVVGIVRRGEESDFLHGRRNWIDQGCFSYIDLNYMSRFHRIWNLDGARAAYIERIVPSYEDGSEQLYPVPASKLNFDKPLTTAQTHLTYSGLFFGTSVFSLLGFLAVLRR